MATNWYRERRDAQALQRTLERFEVLVRDGTPRDEAASRAAGGLEPVLARMFALSVGIGEAAPELPARPFAAAFEERLRSARVVRTLRRPERVHTPGLATLAAAACVVLVAGVLFASSHSLPGDVLYGVKRSSESAQVALASGPVEARMRLGFASKRLDEVEGLVARARGSVVGVPGTAIAAQAAVDFSDPTLTKLIKETLEDAQEQISKAADILISDGKDAVSLTKVIELAHKGTTIANDVVVDLSDEDKPPVIHTAVTLASVEAKAKAALSQLPPPTEEDELPPCDTPTPEPTTTVAPAASPGSNETASPSPSPTPTPTPTPSPSPSPSASPEAAGAEKDAEQSPSPTPCITPSPDPDATESPDPEATAEAGQEQSSPPPLVRQGESQQGEPTDAPNGS